MAKKNKKLSKLKKDLKGDLGWLGQHRFKLIRTRGPKSQPAYKERYHKIENKFMRRVKRLTKRRHKKNQQTPTRKVK